MSEELSGRRVVITGAASGIGAAIASRFSTAGALVAGLDLMRCPDLDYSVQADLRDATSLAAAFAAIESSMGMPDIVVQAAAMELRGGCIDTDPARFSAIYEVNVVGAVRLMRWCVPHMRANGGGAVLLLSSINAAFAGPSLATYAAKAALENLAKTAALEFAGDGIRVNAITPASIHTPRLRGWYEGLSANALEKNKARHPIARFGCAEEVAELALLLASERASWITGAIYPINGGASVTRR